MHTIEATSVHSGHSLEIANASDVAHDTIGCFPETLPCGTVIMPYNLNLSPSFHVAGKLFLTRIATHPFWPRQYPALAEIGEAALGRHVCTAASCSCRKSFRRVNHPHPIQNQYEPFCHLCQTTPQEKINTRASGRGAAEEVAIFGAAGRASSNDRARRPSRLSLSNVAPSRPPRMQSSLVNAI
jgi:hypothetical protein